MTTSKFSVQYTKGTDSRDPFIEASLYYSTWTLFKMFFFSLIGQPRLIWHKMSDHDIDAIAKAIVRWRIVMKFRNERKGK